MDIKNLTSNGLSNRVSDTPSSSVKGSASNTSKSAEKTSDMVTLTSSTTGLEEKASAANVDNSQRIADIKQAIKDGSYQINAEKIAAKLIETETLLAGS